jgi:hypothetical protein
MAEAAANGDAPSGAATASSNPDTLHEAELADADNVPKAVESDPTRRYTRVGACWAVQAVWALAGRLWLAGGSCD